MYIGCVVIDLCRSRLEQEEFRYVRERKVKVTTPIRYIRIGYLAVCGLKGRILLWVALWGKITKINSYCILGG